MAGSANSSDDGEVSGINVTPLVDIMLVLLIIFMVTAKLIEHETIAVELPKAANGGTENKRTLAITMDAKEHVLLSLSSPDGAASIKDMPVDDQKLQAIIRSLPDPTQANALISADTNARHGAVIHILDVLKGSGITKFAFEIEKPQ
jgi:biopolymer transport protein ExbD